MINISFCKITAILLQSEKKMILKNGKKPDNNWCQERDLNSRPPAYETSALTS